jgi:hypothetical protein
MTDMDEIARDIDALSRAALTPWPPKAEPTMEDRMPEQDDHLNKIERNECPEHGDTLTSTFEDGTRWCSKPPGHRVEAVFVEYVPIDQLLRAVEALRWYADPANYHYGEVREQHVGGRARAALHAPGQSIWRTA